MSYYFGVRSRKKTKKEAEKEHSKKKAKKRYNIDLTDELRAQIISAIKHNKPTATLIERQSNRVSLWEVQIGSYPKMRVVYDGKRKEIVTVLHNHDKKGKEKAK